MHHTDTERTLALAGIFQAAHLVQQIARRGMADDERALEASLQSLFMRDAESTEAVYGGARNVALGLRVLQKQLDKHTALRDLELTKYVIGVMHLERQFAARPSLLEKIAQGIEQTRPQLQHLTVTDPHVVAALAGIYSDTLSTLTPRIMVNGEPRHLANAECANTIRALLLAAIRSAVLWRQCGGSRLRLLFSRNATLREIEKLLREP